MLWEAGWPAAHLSEPRMSTDDVATAEVVKEGSGLGHQSRISSVCFVVCIFAPLYLEKLKSMWGRQVLTLTPRVFFKSDPWMECQFFLVRPSLEALY